MKKFIITLGISALTLAPAYSTEGIYYPPQTYPAQRVEYYEPAPRYEEPPVQRVVVENKYAGINTTANVISAIANLLTAIRVLSW